MVRRSSRPLRRRPHTLTPFRRPPRVAAARRRTAVAHQLRHRRRLDTLLIRCVAAARSVLLRMGSVAVDLQTIIWAEQAHRIVMRINELPPMTRLTTRNRLLSTFLSRTVGQPGSLRTSRTNRLYARRRSVSFTCPEHGVGVRPHTQKAIEQAHAEGGGFLVLSHDESAWHAEHLFAVSQDVPGAEMVHLSGDFATKVFEGSYPTRRGGVRR